MARTFRRLTAAVAAALAAPVAVVALAGAPAHADGYTVGPAYPPIMCDRSVAIGNRSANEGDYSDGTIFYAPTLFHFTVTSTCNRGGTVRYSTATGSANHNDFTAISGTLTFEAGDTSAKTVTVWVTRDNYAGTNEYFWVRLSSPSAGITISDSSGVGTIVNDDGECVPPPDLDPGHDWHCME